MSDDGATGRPDRRLPDPGSRAEGLRRVRGARRGEDDHGRRRRPRHARTRDGEVKVVRRPATTCGRKGAKMRRRRRPRRRPLRAAAPRRHGGGRRHRARSPASSPARGCESGIGEKMDDALPAGSAGLIAIYEHGDADKVEAGAPERDPHARSRRSTRRPQGAQGGPRRGVRRAERLRLRVSRRSAANRTAAPSSSPAPPPGSAPRRRSTLPRTGFTSSPVCGERRTARPCGHRHRSG